VTKPKNIKVKLTRKYSAALAGYRDHWIKQNNAKPVPSKKTITYRELIEAALRKFWWDNREFPEDVEALRVATKVSATTWVRYGR